jgi:mono/diheme cytochrome c family protein
MTGVKAAVIGGVALAVTGAAFFAFGGVQAAGLLPHEDARVVAQGQAIYVDHCAACHGANLQGEPDWRRRDADGYLPAPPHDETGHTWHHPDAQLFALTKYGVAAVVGQGYRSRMPGYGGVLSDDEILAVLAYIKSTWPDRVIEIHDRINAEAGG